MTAGPVSRQRWAVLEPLLDAALELEPTERAAFLDNACGTDRALLTEMRALLAACDLGDTILARPASVEYAPLLSESPSPHHAVPVAEHRWERGWGFREQRCTSRRTRSTGASWPSRCFRAMSPA